MSNRIDQLETIITDLQARLKQQEEQLETTAKIYDALSNLTTAGGDQPRSKDLAVKPEPFDGKNYRSFMRAVTVYFTANPRSFATDKQKILFVISLMREGLADEWADNYVLRNTVNKEVLITDKWEDFAKALHVSFGDPNEAMHAQTELMKLRQGETKAEEFFAKFDIYRFKAGYAGDGYNDFLIRLLEMALNASIVQNVLSMGVLPTTYEAWKTAAIQFDNQRRRLREVMQARQQPIRRPIPAPVRPQAAPAPQSFRPPPGPPPASDRRDATGVTFGGQGQPMEITMDRARRSNLCYLCNRPGHIAKNCPSRTLKIREIIQKMDPEECADWSDQFRIMEHRTESEVTAGYWNSADQVADEQVMDETAETQQDFTSPQV